MNFQLLGPLVKFLKICFLLLIFNLVLFLSSARAEKIIITSTKSSDVALSKAISNGATEIHFPKGNYEFNKGIKVSADNLKLSGEGTLVPASKIQRLIDLTGDNNQISLNIDGKNLIENAVRLRGNNVRVTDSKIKNLHGFGKNSAIAIFIVSNGEFNVSNNQISDVFAKGDGKFGNGIGMARGIALARTDVNPTGRGVISGNQIRNILGEEGDSITLANSRGKGVFGKLETSVTNNIIENYSRRAIKIQGSLVEISNNKISNKILQNVKYSCSSAISIYFAKDINVTDNKLSIQKCGVLNVYMNKNNPNLDDSSNLQIMRNEFETTSDNDVPLLNLSVANSNLKGVKIIGNKGIGNSKGLLVNRVKNLEIYNNDIELRDQKADKLDHIRVKQLEPGFIQKNNTLR